MVEKSAQTVQQADEQNLPKCEKVTLFSNPIRTIYLLFVIIFEAIGSLFSWMLKNAIILILLVGSGFCFAFLDGPHEPYREKVYDILYFAGWWMGLGVASSIGLGTGLHTFMLYLGPHIAGMTIAANTCNYVPDWQPSRWRFDHYEPCI